MSDFFETDNQISEPVSFSAGVKDEIAAQPIKKICCRKSMAHGLLLGASFKKDNLVVSVPDTECADFAKGIIKGIFGRDAAVRATGRGTLTFFELSFSSKNALSLYCAFCEGEGEIAQISGFSCPHCASSFLKGLFMSAGSVTDPKKSFHLEYKLQGAESAKKVFSLLRSEGFDGKILNKQKGVSIYFKVGDLIEDIITYFGANNSVFELINAKIEREIRNNENRATNCVAQNIMKSVRASSKQFEAIEKIIYHGLFESLPDELRTTATLRYSNLDVSMAELAALHDPPISKSGLNHRLNKIMDFADSIKKQ